MTTARGWHTMTPRKRTGRPAFGNPLTRSAETKWKMGAAKRAHNARIWTGKLNKYMAAMSARTL